LAWWSFQSIAEPKRETLNGILKQADLWVDESPAQGKVTKLKAEEAYERKRKALEAPGKKPGRKESCRNPAAQVRGCGSSCCEVGSPA